jgi:hypothetical protein
MSSRRIQDFANSKARDRSADFAECTFVPVMTETTNIPVDNAKTGTLNKPSGTDGSDITNDEKRLPNPKKERGIRK